MGDLRKAAAAKVLKQSNDNKLNQKLKAEEAVLKNDRLAKILKRVNANRKVESSKSDEKPKPKIDEKLLEAKSKFSGSITKEEERAQDLYFSVLEKRDEKLLKDLETKSVESKVVRCVECDYTHWYPAQNCRDLGHTLKWKPAKKRFFNCKCGKGRCMTWKVFPNVNCDACGGKSWEKGGAGKVSGKVQLETEKL